MNKETDPILNSKYYNFDEMGNATMKMLLYYCPFCYRTVLEPIISYYEVNKNCRHGNVIYTMILANPQNE